MLTLAVTRRRRSASAGDQAFYAAAEREACAALRVAGRLTGVLYRVDGRGVAMLIDAPSPAAAKALLDGLTPVEMEVASYLSWPVTADDGRFLAAMRTSFE